jgi:hypothetical protein
MTSAVDAAFRLSQIASEKTKHFNGSKPSAVGATVAELVFRVAEPARWGSLRGRRYNRAVAGFTRTGFAQKYLKSKPV